MSEADDTRARFQLRVQPVVPIRPAYDCPYPPPANRLTVAVRAGEMLPYAQPHD